VLGHRSRRSIRRRERRRRSDSYYEVCGLNLREEMARLCRLPVFRDGELPRRLPELAVRRASRRPNRVGFAVPDEWRLSVTCYPGIRLGDVQETLTHELVHLHVGNEPGHHRWHGRRFKQVMRAAMRQGYGISGDSPRSTLHGAYADALERRRARRGGRPRDAAIRGQLRLELPPAA
jgi:hypothetical protein